MKKSKKILVTLLAGLIVGTGAMGFSACGFLNNGDGQTQQKQVPVYQGMTISSPVESKMLMSPMSYRFTSSFNASSNSRKDDNGNHYGQYKGDHKDKDQDIDEENPFPDNKDDETIENEIESSLTVEGADKDIYYASVNEDIYINIHISNPDNFEILSFTLNDKKYSSYMFEAGSDMETIILKYNVGANSGVVDYTIDAIKYVDGTEIKDVLIGGDKTVKAGIRCDNQVTAMPSNVVIGTNSMSFDVNISDKDGLIAYSEGTLKAVLYDGETLVATKDLKVGDNSVAFNNLKTKGLYQCAIVGYYDNFAGDGFGMNLLYKDAFYTESVVLFDNITIGQESIEFGFVWYESFANKTLTALKLYKGETFVKEVATNATVVDGLLSGEGYTLIAEYKNGEATESISLEFTTFAKEVPTITLDNATSTQTSISFEINETDVDNVGAITKIELLHGEDEPIVAESMDVREFTGLLSNNEYTIKITYSYDLNDGLGVQNITKEVAVTTLAKATPEIEIANVTSTQTSVSFEINETDVDNVGAITKIELLHGEDEAIVAESVDVREFTGLLSNVKYTIKVTCTYSLNDGLGNKEVTSTLDIYTNYADSPITYTSYEVEGVTYYSVSSCDTSATSVTIETHIAGNPVNKIEDRAFRNCSKITSITIPESITTIGTQIFVGCSALETVYYNSSFAPAEGVTFLKIASLKKVVFGDNLQHIPDNICYNCTSIEEVILSKNAVTIGANAFYKCSSLKEIDFPISLQTTGWYAFSSSGLTKIIIPEGMTSIYDHSFRDCLDLEYVVLPESLISITSQSFYCCFNIKYIYYKGSETDWEGVSISGNNDEMEVATRYYYSENGPTAEGYYWHYNENGDPVAWKNPYNTASEGLAYSFSEDKKSFIVTGIGTCKDTDLVIPSKHNGKPVTGIGEGAFSNNSNLTSVKIPDSVTFIGCCSFSGCGKLTSVETGNGVATIEGSAFNGCGKLANMVIGSNVTTIGSHAFSSCHSLTSIEIPDGVTSIGDNSFDWCSKLTSVVIPDSVTSIGDKAFYNSALTNIYYKGTESKWINLSIGDSNEALTYATLYCYSETEPTEGGYYWCYDENGEIVIWKVLNYTLNEDGKSYSLAGIGTFEETDIIIPATCNGKPVTAIKENAFYDCDILNSIVIPESVKSIEDLAFYDCNNLTKVVMSNSVSVIGDLAFKHCSRLTDLKLSNSLTYIGFGAFDGCEGLKVIQIPDSVSVIKDYTFNYCSGLNSVVIGKSISSVDYGAFEYCSNLTSVYYKGTAEEWAKISIDTNGNSYLTNATRYYYSETQPAAEGNYWHYDENGEINVWDEEEFNQSMLSLSYTLNGDGQSYSVTGIGSYEGLDIVIPSSYKGLPVTTIGKKAFFENTKITSVIIPDCVTEIGDEAFAWCSGIKTVSIGSGITEKSLN